MKRLLCWLTIHHFKRYQTDHEYKVTVGGDPVTSYRCAWCGYSFDAEWVLGDPLLELEAVPDGPPAT